MTFPSSPDERFPKGDHNRRLSLGIAPDVFAREAGVTEEQLHTYETTPPAGEFDLEVARRVGEALEVMEAVKSPMVTNGPKPTLHSDHNIDDQGRRPDGTREDGHPGAGAAQFEDESVEATRDEEDTTDNPNPSPMNPAFP